MKGLKRLGRAAVFLFVLSVVLSSSAGALVHQFSEDFSTRQYCDTLNTTAWWDTVAGTIKLYPFELTLAGSYDTPSWARDVAIAGDYAYVADYSSGLQVIDISDPTTPTLAGSYNTPGNSRGVAVSGNYAYVADDAVGGLQIIDISNPAAPGLAASYDTPGSAYGVAVAGNYAYVADSDSLYVIDISDPTVPVRAGSYGTPGTAYAVTISGNRAYVADDAQGLQILDITIPEAPAFTGSYDTPNLAREAAVSGDYAYVADYGSGLQVIDISDPSVPIGVGSYDTPGAAYGVAICGDYAYVADYTSGLLVLDISNPASPAFAESYETPGHAYTVAVSGRHAYVADGAVCGLQVIEIADPVLPPLLAGSYNTPSSAIRVSVCGDHAYVADWYGGLRVIDITDPAAPTLAGSYDTPGRAYDVAVSGDYAYVADWDSLLVIDVTDPTNPTREGGYGTSGQAKGVAISGDYAYVADYQSGLLVLDITNPAIPALAGSYNTSGYAWEVAVSGNHAYVADGNTGLQVIDISNPAIPSLAGSYNTPGYAWDVAVSGDYAYVADGDSGLVVLDITAPATPALAGGLVLPDAAYGVAISGDYAYLGGWETGLVVADISDPANPVWAGSRDTPDNAWGVALSGDHAYVGNQSFGLQVIQVFERGSNLDSNVVQSLLVFQTDDEISAVKLTPVQTDSLFWYVSADSGASWDSVPADGGWYGLGSLGGELVWRSTLQYRSFGVGPTCSSLDIEWKYSFGEIDSVRDVPEDQGGWVRIRFDRSGLDIAEGEPGARATSYYVHRRIDEPSLVERILEEGRSLEADRPFSVSSAEGALELPGSFGGAHAYILDGRYYFVSDAPVTNGFPPGAWEGVRTVAAAQREHYYCLVPALADSGAALKHTVFCVSTHTADPGVYYFSLPDSGYSVDNLAPALPQELAGVYSYPPPELLITWRPNIEADLSHYAVYKGATPGFVPDVGNRIGEPADTFLVDTSFDPNVDNYYKVSALDVHWNESDFALLGPDGISGVGETPSAPQVTMLEQNVPNPFNPLTVIRFSIAEPGRVVLRVFDVAGRPVRTLVKGNRETDRYEVIWEGRDDGGGVVASGVYLYKLEAPCYVETKKMVLLR